jgi:hypothetical protein
MAKQARVTDSQLICRNQAAIRAPRAGARKKRSHAAPRQPGGGAQLRDFIEMMRQHTFERHTLTADDQRSDEPFSPQYWIIPHGRTLVPDYSFIMK